MVIPVLRSVGAEIVDGRHKSTDISVHNRHMYTMRDEDFGLAVPRHLQGVPSDAAGGVGGALAFVMGLRHRNKTGKGILIEAPTAENFVPFPVISSWTTA